MVFLRGHLAHFLFQNRFAIRHNNWVPIKQYVLNCYNLRWHLKLDQLSLSDNDQSLKVIANYLVERARSRNRAIFPFFLSDFLGVHFEIIPFKADISYDKHDSSLSLSIEGKGIDNHSNYIRFCKRYPLYKAECFYRSVQNLFKHWSFDKDQKDFAVRWSKPVTPTLPLYFKGFPVESLDDLLYLIEAGIPYFQSDVMSFTNGFNFKSKARYHYQFLNRTAPLKDTLEDNLLTLNRIMMGQDLYQDE